MVKACKYCVAAHAAALSGGSLDLKALAGVAKPKRAAPPHTSKRNAVVKEVMIGRGIKSMAEASKIVKAEGLWIPDPKDPQIAMIGQIAGA